MQTARERTDSYAEKGGHVILRFFFACISNGNAAVLRSELTTPLYRESISRLFGDDLQAARISMSFVSAQAWYVAVQAGVSEKIADAIFDEFSVRIRSAASADRMLDAQIALLVKCAEAVDTQNRPQTSSVQAQRCVDYIRAHICDVLTVQQVASALGFSGSYLSREFRQAMQQTMVSYIQDEKIRTAKLLLQNPALSVGDVMERLGYVSQSHFTKLFREQTGMTPARYRTSLNSQHSLHAAVSSNDYTIQKRTDAYLRLVAYGRRKGAEQQQYTLACVRRGNVRALEEELQNADNYAEICAVFAGDLDIASEAMLTFWPPAMHAACESGLPDEIAVKHLSFFTAQLYACLSVSEVLDLNCRYLTELARAVSQL